MAYGIRIVHCELCVQQERIPMILIQTDVMAQSVLESAIHMFRLSVCLRMETGGQTLRDTQTLN